jgi:hypothetical protein
MPSKLAEMKRPNALAGDNTRIGTSRELVDKLGKGDSSMQALLVSRVHSRLLKVIGRDMEQRAAGSAITRHLKWILDSYCEILAPLSESDGLITRLISASTFDEMQIEGRKLKAHLSVSNLDVMGLFFEIDVQFIWNTNEFLDPSDYLGRKPAAKWVTLANLLYGRSERAVPTQLRQFEKRLRKWGIDKLSREGFVGAVSQLLRESVNYKTVFSALVESSGPGCVIAFRLAETTAIRLLSASLTLEIALSLLVYRPPVKRVRPKTYPGRV